MLTFIVRRIAYSIPVLILASLLVFVFVHATTDPLARYSQSKDLTIKARQGLIIGIYQQPCRTFTTGEPPTAAETCAKTPVLKQYWHWLTHFVRGDMGQSYTTNRAVSSDLRSSFGNTLQLLVFGVLVSAILAVSIGVFSAVRQYTLPDYFFTGLSFVGLSMPAFWFGLIAIDIFAQRGRTLLHTSSPPLYSLGLHGPHGPGFLAGLFDYGRHLILPVATLTVQIVASWSRYQRSSMLDVLSADYIRTATSKGVSRRRVIFKHALRNALIPLVTIMAIDIGALFGGLIITEQVFSIHGMGLLFVNALQNGDTQVLLPWLMVTATFIILFNLLADVMYGVLDPADPAVMKTRRDLGTEVGGKVVVGSPEIPAEAVSDQVLLPGAREAPARSQWHLFLRRFLRHRLAVASLLILVVLYVLVSFPHTTAPYPLNPTALAPTAGPTAKHLLGTDDLGRDQLTRLIYATHLSMTIGLLVAIFSSVIGTLIGAVAGYFGGWVDQLLMRITDLFLIVPAIAVIAMAQQGLYGKKLPIVGYVSSTTLIICTLSVLFWQPIARVVRGLFLSIKEKEFVEAARASGARSGRIMFRHILPNIIGPIVVNTTLVVAAAILLESSLSYLGFGVKPPAVSLGSMLSDAEQWVGTKNSYLIYFPGLVLLIIVLCVNFLGDGLRDAFDPQSKR